MDRMASREQEVLPLRELYSKACCSKWQSLTICYVVVLPPTCPANSSVKELARPAKHVHSFIQRLQQPANTSRRRVSLSSSWSHITANTSPGQLQIRTKMCKRTHHGRRTTSQQAEWLCYGRRTPQSWRPGHAFARPSSYELAAHHATRPPLTATTDSRTATAGLHEPRHVEETAI
jgi:hypothetical protein